MLAKLSRLVGLPNQEKLPSVPEGQRVYAIGDVHGRLDLLQPLADAIEADDASRGNAITTIILLGDLIDRGPDSAGVISFVQEWTSRRDVRVLMANHEKMMLDSMQSKSTMREWLRYGGREMLLSYGFDLGIYNQLTNEELFARLPDIILQDHVDFIADFERWIEIGDYLFVHAGIRPGVPLEEQTGREFYWIREPFLSHRKPHSHVVVHGHTISEEVEERSNRIGIDTGAYETGRLTAIALEGTERRYATAISEMAGSTVAVEWAGGLR